MSTKKKKREIAHKEKGLPYSIVQKKIIPSWCLGYLWFCFVYMLFFIASLNVMIQHDLWFIFDSWLKNYVNIFHTMPSISFVCWILHIIELVLLNPLIFPKLLPKIISCEKLNNAFGMQEIEGKERKGKQIWKWKEKKKYFVWDRNE